MICVVRIRGQVGLNKEIVETLYRLRLRRKYSCVVIKKPSKEQLGMIKNVRDFVAFGEITEDFYNKIVKERGLKDKDGKLKPFFRLHPPRGGLDTKKHFGVKKGVLGDNKDQIVKLVERML